MPKNKGAGGKNFKKAKKSTGETDVRELVFKEEGQEYGQITKMLGGSKVEVHCIDDVKRTCFIRNKIYKKVWLTTGDIVLISTRDYEKNVGDVIHKYLGDEIKNLKTYGELPQTIKSVDVIESIDDDIQFEISDEEDSDNSN